MYSVVKREKDITRLLNTACTEISMDNNKITSARSYQSALQTWYTVNANYFADCSGDSILGVLAKAAAANGKWCGTSGLAPEYTQNLLAQGVRFITLGSDYGMIRNGVRNVLAQYNSIAEKLKK